MNTHTALADPGERNDTHHLTVREPVGWLDRAAMRLALWLLLWSTRRSRTSRGPADPQLARRVREEYERTQADAALTTFLRIR
jgi:hypothetical protein